jgi:hypothetical protein
MYKVNFVGLVCFFKEAGARVALLPDGRNPGGGIDAHHPRLVVGPKRVLSASGWKVAERLSGVFNLPPCTIELQEADQPGQSPLSTDEHDGAIPSLQAIDPAFQIDLDTVPTVARLRIANGKLQAFRFPGTNANNPDVAIISQLRVPHDGPIVVTVSPDAGSVRTITLQPSTEIVIANVSDPTDEFHVGPSHFLLYEQLSTAPVDLSHATITTRGIPPLFSHHVFFGGIGDIGLGADCGNTGCCP